MQHDFKLQCSSKIEEQIGICWSHLENKSICFHGKRKIVCHVIHRIEGGHKFLLFPNFLPLLVTNYNFVMKRIFVMSKPPCSRMRDESQMSRRAWDILWGKDDDWYIRGDVSQKFWERSAVIAVGSSMIGTFGRLKQVCVWTILLLGYTQNRLATWTRQQYYQRIPSFVIWFWVEAVIFSPFCGRVVDWDFVWLTL